jgi:hypothetical protein
VQFEPLGERGSIEVGLLTQDLEQAGSNRTRQRPVDLLLVDTRAASGMQAATLGLWVSAAGYLVMASAEMLARSVS